MPDTRYDSEGMPTQEDKPEGGRRLKEMPMPLAEKVKTKLNDWLNDNINIPLSEKGHPDLGAGISAAVSSAGELSIPNNMAEAALMLVGPEFKIIRIAGKNISKIVPKVVEGVEKVAAKEALPGLEKAGTIAYDKINQGIKTARKVAEDAADTLKYTKEPIQKAEKAVEKTIDYTKLNKPK